MSYEVSCPSCGAAVVFAYDASIVRVCASCRSLLVRSGADIENAGVVAELVSTPSLLRLSEVGSYQGDSFEIVGRVQVAHPSGVWDEWRVAFPDGRYGWIAESLGRRHFLIDVDVKKLPRRGRCRPGEMVEAQGPMIVMEIGEARAKALEGELPEDLRPGETWGYADLAGPNGTFGTIDFGDSDAPRSLYVGREVTLDQIGLGHLAHQGESARAEATALQCPECRGALTLRLPDLSQRVACPYCGTLLAVEGALKAIEASNKKNILTFKPPFPLGAKARFDDASWVVLGMMERSSGLEDGGRYSWREYLLHEPARGFRWLVEDRGHWTLVENAHAGDLVRGDERVFGGRRYKHFVSTKTRVDSLAGEFPWAVTRGETTDASDYICPPMILSEESTGLEFTLSVGRYLERSEVETGFGLKSGTLLRPTGVHAAQPNPFKDRLPALWTQFLVMAATIIVIFMALSDRSKTVYEKTVRIPDGVATGSAEAVFISEPFDIAEGGNLQIEAAAPVNNSWLYLEGTVASTADDALADFDLEAGFYQGVEGGEAWSEGSSSATAFVGSVPAGRYTLRLAPQWGAVAANAPKLTSYRVSVRSNVLRGSYLLIALGLLFLWPIVVTLRSSSFETTRWSESDHAPGE